MTMCIFLWYVVLDLVIVGGCKKKHGKSIRVQTLDTYLGIPLWETDVNLAFRDILKCGNDVAKTMLLEFHNECLKQNEEDDDDEKEDALPDIYRNSSRKTTSDAEELLKSPGIAPNYFSNALDFILILRDGKLNGSDAKNQVFTLISSPIFIHDGMGQVFDRYLAKTGKCRIKLPDEALVSQAKNLCALDDDHCFDDVHGVLYEELKTLTLQFLKGFDIKKCKKNRIMPYQIDRLKWTVRWISHSSEMRLSVMEKHSKEGMSERSYDEQQYVVKVQQMEMEHMQQQQKLNANENMKAKGMGMEMDGDVDMDEDYNIGSLVMDVGDQKAKKPPQIEMQEINDSLKPSDPLFRRVESPYI